MIFVYFIKETKHFVTIDLGLNEHLILVTLRILYWDELSYICLFFSIITLVYTTNVACRCPRWWVKVQGQVKGQILSK